MENEIKKIDKNGEKKCLKISYKLIFIETARFIASSLSNLANNLSKHFHKTKCKYGPDDKKCNFGIKYKIADFIKQSIKDDLTEYKCLCYNKNYQNKFVKNLKKRIANVYKLFKL